MKLTKSVVTGAKALGTIALTAVGLGIAASYLLVDHDVPLEKAVEADRREFESSRAGRLSYYVDGSGGGRPLVLIHSINAAPSTHEMGPLFEAYRGDRPVYSLDLPGFGFSQRGERRYSPELYANAILDFLNEIVQEPADVIALSLGSEFAARAAVQQPEQFHSLTFISPTGLGNREFETPSERIYDVLNFPLWGQPLYDLLTSRFSIRYYLGQSFVGGIPDEFGDYAYATSHQPGARHAPLYFLSGQLFTPGARTELYEQLTRPTLLLYDEDPNISFERLPDLVKANENVRGARLEPSRGLPHWEMLEEVQATLDTFWAENG